jgi:TRAP transporter TAXI family solute receptor
VLIKNLLMNAKRRALIWLIISAVSVVCTGIAGAQDMKFFRIGTGGTEGTYYPIGGLIAHAISNPPGSRPCERGGSCGVPGLVAIAQSSNGSVANINAIRSGALESGFAQSDIVHWAYTGTGIYENRGRVENLRAIASLYQESIHLVARNGAGIRTMADLKGKRVSLDEPGSGTLVDARLILEAYGLTERDIIAEYIKPAPAIVKIVADQLDAFFITAGYPTASVAELTATAGARLVPIDGPQAQRLLEQHSFFVSDTIPAGTYPGNEAIDTISVGAQWVVSAQVDERLIYDIVRALWNVNTRKLLDKGHAKGKHITLENALNGISIPLHPGAEKFYREMGKLQ